MVRSLRVRLPLVLLALAMGGGAGSQEQPGAAGGRRSPNRIPPVTARHGMVVSKEAHASRIGLDILRKGGNAVDAAVAVGFALSVTSPRSAALGGGGFMLIYLAAQKRTIALDYRETSPLDTPKDVFLDADGRPDPHKSRDTGLGVGAPGTVAGLAWAEAHYGSGKFTLAELVAPAEKLAREGVPVADDLEDSLREDEGKLGRFPSSRAIFFGADNHTLHPGDVLRQPDLADTLEAIGRSGPDAFYRGRIAQSIAAAAQSIGGHLSVDDLAAYKVVERAPLRGTYRGYDVVSMPPPSSGGAHVIQILNILEGYPLRQFGANSALTIHLEAEAMKLAFADRAAYLDDPDFSKPPIDWLDSKAYAAQLREKISMDRARPASDIRAGRPAPHESPQTTHFTIVDSEGDAVANTYTLNLSFGVGLVALGTGVVLNNELDDFSAAPGASNAYGLVGGAPNEPAPRKRPVSSMSPTFVFRDGDLALATGSPGGPRIISTVVGIISDIIDHNDGAADANDAPRIHDQWLPDRLYVERGLSPDTLDLLRKMGHEVVEQPGWGAAATIERAPDGGLSGYADPRQRGTSAVGY